MFTVMYINHPTLSRAQKLYHHRHKTNGEAGSSVNDENFNLDWNALIERYENERVLVDNLIAILMNLRSIQQKTSQEFQKLYLY